MFEEGLSYPLEGDSALGRIIIGGLLGLGSILIIPAFALMGYLVWVLEGAARAEPEPPAFEDWGTMIVDGIKAVVVALVYGIVPLAMIIFGVFAAAGGAASGSDAAAGILGGIGAIGLLVGLLAMLIMYYLIPAALTSMAVQGSLGAAFDFSTLKDVLLSVDYLVAWFIPFVIAVMVNVVVWVLALAVVGLLLVPFIQFYVQVAIFYMFGTAFGNVTELNVGKTSGPAVTPS